MKNNWPLLCILMAILICLVLLSVLTPLPLVWEARAATDIYVSATGSGTSCTKASPCSASQGLSSFPNNTAGTIHFADGTYSSGMDISRNGASSSSKLTLQCDNGLASAFAAAGHCKFTNAMTVAANAVGGNNINIIGFDVGNNVNMPYCIDVISDSSGGAANNVTYQGNYCHDLAQNVKDTVTPFTTGCPLNGAIQGNNSTHHLAGLKIIGNFIKNFGGGYPLANCNHGQGIYTESAGVVIQNNILVNIPVGGIVIRENCNNVVSNNVVIGAKHGIILNNSNTSDCAGGLNGHNNFDNNYFYTGYDSSIPGYAIFFVSSNSICTGSTPNSWNHNMRSGAEISGEFSAGKASCDMVSPSTFVKQAAASFFVNYSGNDFHLKAGSLGIGTGITAANITPTVDIYNNTRTGAMDVGAVAANGTPGGGTVSVNPPSMTFPDTFTTQTSAALDITLTNNTASAVNLTSIVASTNYARTTDCNLGGTLPAGAFCTAHVTFTPPSTGTFNGTVVFTFVQAASPITVNVTGNGITPSAPSAPTGLTVVIH